MLGLALVATLTGLAVGALTTPALLYIGEGLISLGVPASVLPNLEWATATTALFFGISGGIAALITEGESEVAQAWKARHPSTLEKTHAKAISVGMAPAREASFPNPVKSADAPPSLIASCEAHGMLAQASERAR